MKRCTLWLVTALIGVLTFVSFMNVAGACNWMFYEPEVPAKLRR